jgi:hypothetical protein
VKPKCEPLQFTKPDEATKRRAAEIKEIVAKEFGDEIRRPGEPRFQFIEKFNAVDAKLAAATPTVEEGLASPRFIYSYCAVYGDCLLNSEADPFPDGLLQRLSSYGINGVWLHVVLRDLAPGGKDFPEFGEGCEKRMATLRNLVNRAKKFGIGIYLYMNEPRAMPVDFFKNRPEMAGVREGEFVAMCTSNPAVRQWMSNSLTYVFHEVPDLAGVFTITASENLSNCASHGGWKSCPNCKDRTDSEIIADVNTLIEQAVHKSNPKANVIAWDWGWKGHGDSTEIIKLLSKQTWLMSVSEWALPIERGGVKSTVGEYSISSVGPGPRATSHWKLAQEAGLRAAAKMQLNNTWEFSTVPYLPVMDLVAEHCHNLASAGVQGMLLSWSLGGYPSPNLEIAAKMRANPTPSIDDVLNTLATKRYGPEGAPLARKAWSAFSTAFREYPYSCGLYQSPVQMGPANLLYPEKTGFGATMVGIPYDDLIAWQGIYPPEIFAAQFEKVAKGWWAGIPDLKAAVEKAPANSKAEVQAELRYAQTVAIHCQSVVNQSRFIMARNKLADTEKPLSAEEQKRLRDEIVGILQSEIDLARQEFSIVQQDSCIGFEASNQYVFVPFDLGEKVLNCRWLLEQYKSK